MDFIAKNLIQRIRKTNCETHGMWKESELRVLVKVTVVERIVVCISNAAVKLVDHV